jgi:hypothetical protein
MLQFYAHVNIVLIIKLPSIYSNMNKVSLISALAALLMLPAISFAATTADLDAGPNSNWPSVLTCTTPVDGAASQLEQEIVMNVTALPAGGANYRVYKTVANGNGFNGNPQALIIGENVITVSAVVFDRTVKIQFSSDAVEFDALTVNGVDSMPASNTEGGLPIADSAYFDAGPNSSWPAVTTLTTTADGVASQAEQTLVMNVTALPAGGADYRVYKTTANGSDFFANPIALSLGENNITVDAVGFDRAVKIQFSSDAIEFDALTVNGETLWPADTSGSSTTIASSNEFVEIGNPTWLYKTTLTTAADGVASQAEQTLVMNITSLPGAGANYRVLKTVANGNWYVGPSVAIPSTGELSITVGAVGFDRSVNIQFSSGDIEFTELTINDVALWPIEIDDSGDTVTLANSNLFNAGPNENWVTVLTTAVSQDGATSQGAQTVEMYITSLPPAGANYRIYRTTANGGSFLTNAEALSLGVNTISIPGVAFDRSVKVQFSSDAIEYNALIINGVARVVGATVAEVPSVSIDGTTLSWTETDGTSLQFSEDLESWTSLPSATSPYSPSTSPDRFYRTITDE